MSVALTLIVPAYNEAQRLPPFLDDVRAYLPGQFSDDYEVIVVDDGSTDGLPTVVEEMASDWPQLRAVCHSENQGKGAAVRTGMLMGRGELLLFADADGATPIAEEAKLRAAIEAGADVAVGSRLLGSPEVTRDRTWFRGMVGRAFALAARWMLHVPVRDTQCGFKMFRRDAGRHLFSLVEENGYLFDLEILILAESLGCQVSEVPVNWSEVAGGHLSVGQHWKMVVAGLRRLRAKRKTVLADRDRSRS
ncbi:MAG: glycosyltransferase family 2 protein [Planctomycetes bacterium]|nr:glycosyltransferase family 2 protein [Planctomycetota bacterium]MBL7037543.1 glycosyltransferase family 2 protein [Pirellulaceae bacterium]